jgi:hypothetical protein
MRPRRLALPHLPDLADLPSLLAEAATVRLGVAAGASAVLWLAVFWAIG